MQTTIQLLFHISIAEAYEIFLSSLPPPPPSTYTPRAASETTTNKTLYYSFFFFIQKHPLLYFPSTTVISTLNQKLLNQNYSVNERQTTTTTIDKKEPSCTLDPNSQAQNHNVNRRKGVPAMSPSHLRKCSSSNNVRVARYNGFSCSLTNTGSKLLSAMRPSNTFSTPSCCLRYGK